MSQGDKYWAGEKFPVTSGRCYTGFAKILLLSCDAMTNWWLLSALFWKRILSIDRKMPFNSRQQIDCSSTQRQYWLKLKLFSFWIRFGHFNSLAIRDFSCMKCSGSHIRHPWFLHENPSSKRTVPPPIWTAPKFRVFDRNRRQDGQIRNAS